MKTLAAACASLALAITCQTTSAQPGYTGTVKTVSTSKEKTAKCFVRDELSSTEYEVVVNMQVAVTQDYFCEKGASFSVDYKKYPLKEYQSVWIPIVGPTVPTMPSDNQKNTLRIGELNKLQYDIDDVANELVLWKSQTVKPQTIDAQVSRMGNWSIVIEKAKQELAVGTASSNPTKATYEK